MGCLVATRGHRGPALFTQYSCRATSLATLAATPDRQFRGHSGYGASCEEVDGSISGWQRLGCLTLRIGL